MSLFDYRESRRIEAEMYPFYSLIMAAMRQADDVNIEKLRSVFPEIWAELRDRYMAPGGLLPEEIKTDG